MPRILGLCIQAPANPIELRLNGMVLFSGNTKPQTVAINANKNPMNRAKQIMVEIITTKPITIFSRNDTSKPIKLRR